MLKLKIITIVMIIFSVLLIKGNTHTSQYEKGTDLAFHDAFYTYYGESKKKAKRILKRLMRDPDLRSYAEINYGLIKQWEKDYEEAERLYNKSMEKNNSRALSYLMAFYQKHWPEKTQTLLRNIAQAESGCWIEYELAMEELGHKNRQAALRHLENAVGQGLPLANLAKHDPRIEIIKNRRELKKLIHISGSKGRKTNYTSSLDESLYEKQKDKPWGISKELSEISELEKKGNLTVAKEELLGLLNKRILFRDKSIALYWLTRINVKLHDFLAARDVLTRFYEHLDSKTEDPTGYRDIVVRSHRDIICSDEVLKSFCD